MDIPILYRHHQRRGPTFQAHALLSQPSIITIAPANIRVVNTGKDWGVAPMRLAGMEYFCGRGFLTTDGDLWSRSRKLLKPTFNKANLTNLSFLSAQVDTMLQQLPKNGTTVDLQPLFYTMYLDYYVDQALVEAGASSAKSEKGLDNATKLSMIRSLSVQTNEREYIRNQILQGMMASQETDGVLMYWSVLRLYPIFPLMSRTALKDQKLPVGGGPNKDLPVFVPRGILVVMSYYALHQDPAVFGEDAEDFRPERWDKIRPGQWTFMAFGGGNRACLGQPKVLVEAAYVLSANGCKVALI
ncbi:putative cytochrome 52A12 [Trematosphaeria pertusa]|uniref:Putative cytochrome 52A12 n=1 Tax=Trematosphaeria pertusa TaxID=390896 RepID=A0A6A6J043_9PLEO|nr:putative cytochrome 52A12 [Trematosphaeria pertusa]KAF2256069.1 putative cytochrome 52A12 [Trematosphaeria pertusa]